MSIHDDSINGSGVQLTGHAWHPFEPCSALFVAGVEFRRGGLNFLYCRNCDSYLDPWDIAVGSFGDFHCTYCASTDLKI